MEQGMLHENFHFSFTMSQMFNVGSLGHRYGIQFRSVLGLEFPYGGRTLDEYCDS